MGTLTSKYMKIKKMFGRRLKQARIAAEFDSAEQAAHALGLEPPTYRTYERGSSLPNIEVLLRICELFEITPDELLIDSSPKKRRRADPAPTAEATVTPAE
jgi:transcriptional regulator with XRE-family HTH domain